MLEMTSFCSSILPEPERLAAWRRFMTPFKCSVVAQSGAGFSARAKAAATPWGFALAGLHISAQRLTFDTRALDNGLWLMEVAEGGGTIRTERGSQTVEKGDLLYGKTAREMALTARSELRVNLAYFPRTGAGARLASIPPALVASRLRMDHGSTAFLSGLLMSAIDKIPRISPDEIRPLETAITEFLFAAVASASAAGRLIEGSRTRNAIVLRATQLLEAQLCDPELSPTLAAQQLGISLRYLQKLFEEAGENVNHYIRRRRLERSHDELMDPLYQHQSISEISFRWGFNDSAYFSRTFKDMFGVSPSQHRDSCRWPAQQNPDGDSRRKITPLSLAGRRSA